MKLPTCSEVRRCRRISDSTVSRSDADGCPHNRHDCPTTPARCRKRGTRLTPTPRAASGQDAQNGKYRAILHPSPHGCPSRHFEERPLAAEPTTYRDKWFARNCRIPDGCLADFGRWRRALCAAATGRDGKSVEVAVELSVCDCALLGCVKADREGSAEPDCGECDVGRGESRWNRFVAVRGVD